VQRVSSRMAVVPLSFPLTRFLIIQIFLNHRRNILSYNFRRKKV
jgi:hypothetical protein